MNTNELSEQLLLAVKKSQPTTALTASLAEHRLTELEKELATDDDKKAFWINIYNAYYQILRSEGFHKPEIYRHRLFKIAGKKLSLDDVEHGILRKYRYKYSLGFFANIFVGRLIKRLAVDELDYRIHFALNCGAKSCPPIAFYKSDLLNKQLDLATQSFLEGETDYNDTDKVAHVTRLFQWFLGDFGGVSGIKRIYKDQLAIDISDYRIKYKAYSWDDELGNFTDLKNSFEAY